MSAIAKREQKARIINDNVLRNINSWLNQTGLREDGYSGLVAEEIHLFEQLLGWKIVNKEQAMDS